MTSTSPVPLWTTWEKGIYAALLSARPTGSLRATPPPRLLHHVPGHAPNPLAQGPRRPVERAGIGAIVAEGGAGLSELLGEVGTVGLGAARGTGGVVEQVLKFGSLAFAGREPLGNFVALALFLFRAGAQGGEVGGLRAGGLGGELESFLGVAARLLGGCGLLTGGGYVALGGLCPLLFGE